MYLKIVDHDRFGHDTGLGYNRQFRYEERDDYGVVKGRSVTLQLGAAICRISAPLAAAAAGHLHAVYTSSKKYDSDTLFIQIWLLRPIWTAEDCQLHGGPDLRLSH